MTLHCEHIEEVPVDGKPLGRHVEHDPKSKDYAIEEDTTITYKTVSHMRYGSVLNQGQLGSCTGNACAGVVNTAPVHDTSKPILHEADALALYELATKLDSISGSYPPTDTGSSGLAAAKAAMEKGYITSYKHAFSIGAALTALQSRPIMVGVVWYEGFDSPNETGLVEIAGQIRGGHEFEILGFKLESDLNDSLVIAENSWGTSYGVNGRFNFTVATLQRLLEDSGDVTVLFR